MPSLSWIRRIAIVATFAMLISSCGWFLYPERRGQRRSGNIDVAVLVMDILWFIPGIIPGVVALAVDFTSGTIYSGPRHPYSVRVPGGRASLDVTEDMRLVVTPPQVDRPRLLTLRLVTSEGEVLGSIEHQAMPGKVEQPPIELALGAIARDHKARGPAARAARLEMLLDGKIHASTPVSFK